VSNASGSAEIFAALAAVPATVGAALVIMPHDCMPVERELTTTVPVLMDVVVVVLLGAAFVAQGGRLLGRAAGSARGSAARRVALLGLAAWTVLALVAQSTPNRVSW
jgi:hypothetical protein